MNWMSLPLGWGHINSYITCFTHKCLFDCGMARVELWNHKIHTYLQLTLMSSLAWTINFVDTYIVIFPKLFSSDKICLLRKIWYF